MEDDLRLAVEHLARAQSIVSRQEAIIGQLKRDGCGTSVGDDLLGQFCTSIELFEKHRRMIEDRLTDREN